MTNRVKLYQNNFIFTYKNRPVGILFLYFQSLLSWVEKSYKVYLAKNREASWRFRLCFSACLISTSGGPFSHMTCFKHSIIQIFHSSAQHCTPITWLFSPQGAVLEVARTGEGEGYAKESTVYLLIQWEQIPWTPIPPLLPGHLILILERSCD